MLWCGAVIFMVLFFVLYGCHQRFLFPGIVDCDGRGRRRRGAPEINMKLMTIGPPLMNNTPSLPSPAPPPPLHSKTCDKQQVFAHFTPTHTVTTTESTHHSLVCFKTQVFTNIFACEMLRSSTELLAIERMAAQGLGRKKIAETSTKRWPRRLRSVSCLLAFLGHAFRSARHSLCLGGLWNHGRS